MVLLHHIIVYYITRFNYSISYYAMVNYLVLFLLFSFYFHFYSPIRFTFIHEILFHLVLHLLFYLVFLFLYLLSFYIIIPYLFRVIPSAKNVEKRPTVPFLFSLDIYENTFYFFCFFLDYYSFKGTCLKFY